MSAGRSVTIASLPTTAGAGVGAGTYSTAPENSRLLVTSKGKEAACRHERDLRGSAGTAEYQDLNTPAGESPSTYTFTRHAIRSNYMDKSIDAKKKVPEIRCNVYDNKNVYEFVFLQ
jgi:hypothetical protein